MMPQTKKSRTPKPTAGGKKSRAKPRPKRPTGRAAKKPTARKSAAERLQRKSARREQRRAYRSAALPTTTAPAETAQAQLEALTQKLAALQQAAALTDIHDDLADVDGVLATLPADIEALRARGYVFRSYLERKVEVLSEQWAEARERVLQEIERRSRELARNMDQAERALQAAQTGGTAQISRAESAVQMLESKVSAAQDSIEAMFDALDDNVTQTQAQVEAIEWALDQADQASFDFYPAEDLVAACRAQLLETKKEGPEGVLFLTDERLIFERKEEVATKKVLFITTEKETIQEPVFAVPIGQIEEVKASQAGFLGHKEMLEIGFSREAPLSQARLRLRGADNEEWAGLIGRVRSSDIAGERTRPKEEAAVEAAREVPTKCPTCGAVLTTPVVKGMREITCEYCGTVIRL
jgi:predicted  nucleic acid-binding Zn-ribbon protein